MENKLLQQSAVYSVAELSAILRIGRNKAYTLVRSGEIHSIRIGRTIRIPYSAIEQYLRR